MQFDFPSTRIFTSRSSDLRVIYSYVVLLGTCSFIWQGTSTMQETAKRLFRSLSQASTCYYLSDHSEEEAILISAMPKRPKGYNKRTYQLILHYSLNSERQARKLWITTF